MEVKPSASYDDSDWNDWKKDEWKDAWRDEYSDWELWKQMKDEEIAAKRRENRRRAAVTRGKEA